MKKMLLTLFVPLLFTTSYAQEKATAPGLHYPTEKGSLLVGSNVLLGGVGFSNAGTYYNIGISPRAGYFILDNLAAGAELNGNFQGQADFNSHSFGGSLFARYYFGKAMHKDGTMVKTRFFAEAGAGYFTGNSHFSESYNPAGSYKFSSSMVRGMVGMNYFLNNNVAIEGGVFYRHSSKDYVNDVPLYNPTQLGFNIGLQLFLGRKR